MARFEVVSRDGSVSAVEGENGMSVMEALRVAGSEELTAICGGGCACATCHIYVDESFRAKMAAVSDDEADLLESSLHRTGDSRLSCQIMLDEALDGMRIVVAPED